MRAALPIALALALTSMSGTAVAQSAAERNAAQALFDEGVRLFRAGKYMDACPKFEESLKLFDGLGTRGKLAECYEKQGRMASAWSMYREVAELAAKAGERRRQRVAEQRSKKLEPMLAHMTIRLSDAVKSLQGIKVVKDNVELGQAILGTRVPVDSGTHTLLVSADGYKAWEQTVQVPPKGDEVVEVPALEKLPPPPVEPDPVPVPTQTTISKQPETSSWRTPTSIGLIAGGTVGVGVGLVFGALAKSKWDKAFKEGCEEDTNVCTPEGKELADSAKTRANVSTILTISGVALAGAGVVLWLWPSDDSGAERVGLTPTVTGDQVGFSLSRRF